MVKDTFFEKKRSLSVGGRLRWMASPWIMGILNVTPDSFYEGSRVHGERRLIEQAGKMVEEGASILDIGGYSSRPGADHIPESEELDRAIPAIRKLREAFPELPVSVDTFRSSVAEKALEEGADMVNDISAGELDPSMMDLVAEAGVPYILMHMPGTPQDMKERTDYEDVTSYVLHYLSERCRMAKEKGVNDIIVDPGFGFGKTVDQNYQLLKKLGTFNQIGLPLLVGLSRKSMLWKELGIRPEDALNGTTVLHTLALQRGADILRVHDVREAAEAVRILKFDGNAGGFE